MRRLTGRIGFAGRNLAFVCVALAAPSTVAAQAGGDVTLRLYPADTYLNIDSINHSLETMLGVYTWPDRQPANAIVMKFDLSSIPADAVLQQATLNLFQLEADGSQDATYDVSAYKILRNNPNIARATGYRADRRTAWTRSACCYNRVPLAQADLSAPYDTQSMGQAQGFRTWLVTNMVYEWLVAPASNYGVVLNADTTKPRDRYRYFASNEYFDPNLRPYLEVRLSTGTAPVSGVVTEPVTEQTVTNIVTTEQSVTNTVTAPDGEDLSGVTSPAPVQTSTVGSNEEPGLTLLTDQPWNQMTGLGWDYLRRTSSKNDDITFDGTAPFSPSNALRIIFTPDMQRDSEPSVHWVGVPKRREAYASWWMKLSPNWTCSPAGCGKVAFMFTDGLGQVYTGVFHSGAGDGPPYRIAVNTEWEPYGQEVWFPNVSTTPINPGEWHQIEVYYKWETIPGVSGDGVIRFWVDGLLNGTYTNIHYPPSSFIEFQYAPTLQYPPPAEQYMYIDHTKVSTR